MIMRLIVATCVLALVAGCAPTAVPSPQPPSAAPGGPTAAPASPTPTVDRIAGWHADLAALLPGMQALHPQIAHSTPLDVLHRDVAELDARVSTASDDELMVGILRIVAQVSRKGCDGHTGAFIWGTGHYPVDSLPLRLWVFDDGIYVVDALDPYRGLIGQRIDAIAGTPVNEVTGRVQELVPQDNQQTIRLLLPRYLLIPQVLRGLGLAGAGPIDLDTRTVSGATLRTSVVPIPMAAYNAWAGPYGLHLPADPNVLYLSRIDDALWWEPLPDDPSTIFVQYNRVDLIPTATLASLRNALLAPGVDRIVLDVRHNYGGEESQVNEVVAVFHAAALAHPGNLSLIIGRNTFSAASLFVARLVRSDNVKVLGEGMGGCPTTFANSRDVTLPFSGIAVSVATALVVGVDAADQRDTIDPDVPTPLTIEDWLNGTDPALAVLATHGP